LLQNPCPRNLHPVRKIDGFLDDLMKYNKKVDLKDVLDFQKKLILGRVKQLLPSNN